MRCDMCNTPLASDYAPQVDARGRPCLAVCTPCNDAIVLERAQRLGINAQNLTDEFERHLRKQGFPERVH